MSRASELNSSSARTSASAGAPGSPTRRESCATVISVGEGMTASTSNEDMDAIFQPRPHGAIAVSPRRQMHISTEIKSTLRPGHAELLESARVAGRLGEEPIPKGHDLWQRCRGLWADDPIGLGKTQLLGKRAQQSS